MDFLSALNKAINGKNISRPSWTNSIYCMIPLNCNNIYKIFPLNVNNPAQLYSPSIEDIQASDWASL
jgi:hypothetical protein